MLEFDKILPIHHIREQLLNNLKEHNRCILHAPPGSGKSTMIPQYLLDDILPASSSVIVLQPRRIAARMLASFVAQQRHSRVGDEVGYQVRLENKQSSQTRILYVTEGILMNRLLQGDTLQNTGAIIFDEFHERHLETDMGLALAMQLQRNHRPDLKLIVMSATLNISLVRNYMQPCPLIETAVSTYPITISYKQPRPYDNLWDFAAQQVESALPYFTEGSALLFMPGSFEIRKTLEALQKRAALQAFEILPLHGSLSKEEQELAVREGGRKIIVSTNVAETSLTIPGIRLVVDSGLARIARFDPKRGINTLFTEPISISSADQRAGRAGRLAPGTCIRLWSEFSHDTRSQQDTPEIFRVDLAEVLLGLLAHGTDDPLTFNWMERPHSQAMNAGMDLLHLLGAIDAEKCITPDGRKMAALNIPPRFARMLLKAVEMECLGPASVAVAIVQQNGILNPTNDAVIIQEREHLFGYPGSDLLFEVNAWLWAGRHNFNAADCRVAGINTHIARQVGQAAVQLMQKAQPLTRNTQKLPDENISWQAAEKLRECIFYGFPDNLAIRHRISSPVCQMMFGRSGKLHRDSTVQDARLMVVTGIEEVRTPSGVQVMLRMVTEIDEAWLSSLSSGGSEKTTFAHFDEIQRKVVKVTEHRLNGLILSHQEESVTDPEEASRLLTRAILDEKLSFPQWNDDVEYFVRRVNFASRHAPDYQIPPIDNDAREFILQQTLYFCTSEKDLQKCNLWNALKEWLSFEQLSAVDYMAPVFVTLPYKNKKIKLRYDEKGDVIVSETIQAFYDCPPIRIAEGRASVVYEILAPSRRPVQITRDLDYFWKNSYLDIKKELKGRYPKHEWR